MRELDDVITYACPHVCETYQNKHVEAHFRPVPSEPPYKYFCAHTREQGHEHITCNTSEHDACTLPDSIELFYVLKARHILEHTPALALIVCQYKDRFVDAYAHGNIIAISNEFPHMSPSYFSVWDMRLCKKSESESLREHAFGCYNALSNDELKKNACSVWSDFQLKHFLSSYYPTCFWADEKSLAAYAIYCIIRKRSNMRALKQKDIDRIMVIREDNIPSTLFKRQQRHKHRKVLD